MKRAILTILLLALIFTVPACNLLAGADETLPPYDSGSRKPLTFKPADLPAAEAGKPYEVKVEVGNVETFAGLFEIQDGRLPPGLVLERVKNENAVKITGIPEIEGDYPFVLFVQCMGTNDPGQEGIMNYTIEVKPAP
jgi:hypothetical protein